jgi:5-methylcytosine-specific restriction endonuclease McrA
MVDEEILAAVFEIREIQQQIAFELYNKLDCKCFICNTDLMISKISRDHVFPRSMGFKLCRNMMPVHRGCNNKKGNAMPTYSSVMRAKTTYSSIGIEFKPQRVITDFYPNRILKLAEKSIRVAQEL